MLVPFVSSKRAPISAATTIIGASQVNFRTREAPLVMHCWGTRR